MFFGNNGILANGMSVSVVQKNDNPSYDSKNCLQNLMLNFPSQ